MSQRTLLPLTRADALATWAKFLPKVGRYSAERNFVIAGHANVSRLSPALRHRLVTEDEIIRETLRRFSFQAAEKWLQEICWRRYWKGWLEMRPQVWTEWQQRVREMHETLPCEILERANAVAAGGSGVACMDFIARELVETGYLHNHARMWWASFWIHAEGLPWELGADFFFRHLLDADPASNTLSWRWVAGLQTQGKSYLVRLSNLEKYASPELLENRRGIERIADGAIKPASQGNWISPTKHPLPDFPSDLGATTARPGLWIHGDDLSPEIGPLAALKPVAVAISASENAGFQLPEMRQAALQTAVADGFQRAAAHYRSPVTQIDKHLPTSLAEWAGKSRLTELVTLAPFIGPTNDQVPELHANLHQQGIRLTLIRRQSDADAFAMADAGFFPFWQKMERHIQSSNS